MRYNQKLCRVKCLLAIELPLFSRIMQTRYHLKEFKEWNLILRRLMKFIVYFSCKNILVSNETVMSSD